MIFNCYFCGKALQTSKYKKSLPYKDYYYCFNCPEVVVNYEDNLPPICKIPFYIYLNEHSQVEIISLFLPNIKKWLQIFKFQKPVIIIQNSRAENILRLTDTSLNISDMSLEALENKVKTWILFS